MAYRHFRLVSFFLALAVIAALFNLRGQNATAIRRDTPAHPDAFMRGATRKDLTDLANRLLGLSYISITTPPNAPTTASTLPGTPPSSVPSGIDSTLRRYGFQHASVGTSDSAAVFISVQGRVAYRYTYSARALGPPYTVPSALTASDFSEWSELQRIGRLGMDSSECARNRVAFEPTIVYPYLQQSLGDSQLSAIASKPGPDDITLAERSTVMRVLNDQRLSRSRLIEHPRITYDPGNRFGLALGPTRLSNVFWPVRLLDTLLSTGAIQFAADHRHLRIRDTLSANDQRRVEWLHVGLMNFLYGNLIEKPDPGYDADLGGGWYFRRD